MNAVWYKVWHEIRARRKAFAFLFVMIMLVAGLVNVVVSSTVQGNTLYAQLLKRLNGADVWVYLTPKGVQAYEHGQIHLTGVKFASSLHPALNAKLSAGNLSLPAQVFGYPAQQPSFDGVLITEGRYLSENVPYGVVVDVGLKNTDHLRIGEQITLTSGRQSHAFTIRGFEADASHLPYPHSYPPVLALPAAVAQFAGNHAAEEGGFISFRLTNAAHTQDTVAAWSRQIPASWAGWIYGRNEISLFYREDNMITAVFQDLFVVFAVLAAWLIVSNLVSTAILDQTRQIGILKALGFTKRQIRGVYALANVAVSLLATVVGIAVSVPVAKMAAAPMVKTIGLTRDIPHQSIIWVLEILFLLITVLLASWLPSRTANRMTAISALRSGTNRTRKRGFGLMERGARMGLPFPFSMAIRDLLARPLRSLGGLITMIFAVCTITFSLIVSHAIASYQENPALLGLYADIQVVPNSTTATRQIVSTLANTKGVNSYITTWFAQGEAIAGTVQKISFYAQSSSSGNLPYIIQKGRGLEHPGEVIVGEGALSVTGLHIGDRLPVKIAGKSADLRIVGQYLDMNNGGQEAVISKNTLMQYMNPTALEYDVELSNYHQTNAMVHSLTEALGNEASVTSMDVSLPPEATQVKTTVLWYALVLGSIALLSLFNALFRSVLERRHDFAVLKSMGMRPLQIIWNVILTGLSLATVASVVGVILGIQALKGLNHVVSNMLGSGGFPMPTPWAQVIWSVAAVVITAIAVSLIPAIRAGYVRPAKVLQTE